MLSFIVIGQNEGEKLLKCFDGIKKTIQENNILDCEIIYVDSDSEDQSVDIALKNGITTFCIRGGINAAIARNVGAKYARGEVLFFIDGDMEIIPNFLPLVYNISKGISSNFISGNWMNYFYDYNGNLINKEKYLQIDEDLIETTTGGLFLIKKKIWDELGGMDEKFKKSQDIDLGLRLAKKEIFLLRKKEVAANHYTVSYMNKIRMWKDLFKGNHFYTKSLLYRKHFFNKHVYKRLLSNDYSMLLLFFTLMFLFVSSYVSALLFLSYLLLILVRSKFKLHAGLYYCLRDFSSIVGVFVFFPRKNIYQIERISC